MVDILKRTNGWTHFPSTFDLHNMASVFETKKYLPPTYDSFFTRTLSTCDGIMKDLELDTDSL